MSIVPILISIFILIKINTLLLFYTNPIAYIVAYIEREASSQAHLGAACIMRIIYRNRIYFYL